MSFNVTDMWRGEVEIVLDGENYILKPTFHALSQIEHELSTGIISLAGKLAEGMITLEELSVVIVHCATTELSIAHLKETLVHSELSKIIQAIAHMFCHVIGGENLSSLQINRGDLEKMSAQFPDTKPTA